MKIIPTRSFSFNGHFDRRLLPTPLTYYQQQFPYLKIKPKCSMVCCPFHSDHHPSFGINLITGGFHCFACGESGKDVIAFHMKLYHMTFLETIKSLGAYHHGRV